MAYRPYSFTVTTTPQAAFGYDPNVSVRVVTNESSVTVYYGNDASVTSDRGKSTSGAPISANNGRVQFSRNEGLDPRLMRFFVVASGTATIVISEEAMD